MDVVLDFNSLFQLLINEDFIDRHILIDMTTTDIKQWKSMLLNIKSCLLVLANMAIAIAICNMLRSY